MQLLTGSPDGPLAVLLPGTASTGDFVRRAFGAPLAAFGIGLISDDPPRAGTVAERLAGLDEAVARYRPVLVGGVSIGAHLAVRWAAARTGGHRPDGLLLAMPAWTGPPEAIAAASGAAAGEVERAGVSATLRRIRAGADDWPDAGWVVDELAAAWPRYTATELAGTLRATAGSPGPSRGELASDRAAVRCGCSRRRPAPSRRRRPRVGRDAAHGRARGDPARGGRGRPGGARPGRGARLAPSGPRSRVIGTFPDHCHTVDNSGRAE